MVSSSFNSVTGAPQFADTDAPDVAGNASEVAAFAATVGTRLLGTTAQRNAYVYGRDGLRWYDTTLDREFIHNGSGWVYAPGEAILSGSNKGDTVHSGGWRALNTAAGVGQNHRNDGFVYGAGIIGVPQPGMYDISATVYFPALPGGDRRAVRVTSSRLDDSGMAPTTEVIFGTVPNLLIRVNASGIIPVQTGFAVEAYQNVGGNMTVTLAHVSARYVGPL